MDRLRRMEMLVSAADAGSFARAAQLLRIDPSTVSHAIAEFEKELRTPLFYRTTRQLSLTEEGRDIVARARDVLSRMAELETSATRPRQGLSGTVRLGSSVPISRTLIMPRLPEFMDRNPKLNIESLVITQVKDMHAGAVDVMVRAGTPPESALIARKIATMRFGVYASPTYLETRGEPHDPEELSMHRCLVHKPPVESRPWDEWRFERAGERRTVKVPRSLVTDDREGMIGSVLSGAGLMRIGMFEPELIAAGQLRKVLPDWECVGGQPVYLLYRKGALAAPRIAAFVDFIYRCFAEFDKDQLTLVCEPGIRGRTRSTSAASASR
jgi:DNA-binding transcriptional LysR family regulator